MIVPTLCVGMQQDIRPKRDAERLGGVPTQSA